MASSVLALATVLALSVALVASFSVIRDNSEKGLLDNDQFLLKYSNLVVGLRVEDAIGRYWQLITLVRWFTLCIILVVLADHPAF
jgi:hypothetical protein